MRVITSLIWQALLDLGVIPAADMTVEACVAKLAYLCGRGLRGARLKASMVKDLRGEISLEELTEGVQLTHIKAERQSKL